jgi:two-component system, LytTR family, sensor kinase
MIHKERLYWTLQLGGWGFYTVFQIVFFGAERISTTQLVFWILEAFCCLLLTHGLRQGINHWRWFSLGLPKLIPRVIFSVLLMAVALYGARILFSLPLGQFNSAIAFSSSNFFGLTLLFAFIFFLWASLYFVYNYFERYNKSLKLEATVKEIELTNLKSQLNPHFIFNALNSIRALIDENPEKCKQAVNQLATILRSSLATGKKGLTPFEDELRIVKDYIGLEQIRFEERLKASFDIDDESLDFLVPPLMVQTLVENGIKHGISKLTEGGSIHLKTEVHDDRLKILVRNSGAYVVGEHTSPRGLGLGLDNTTHRLKLIYGEAASLHLSAEKNNFVLVEVEIPHIYQKTES